MNTEIEKRLRRMEKAREDLMAGLKSTTDEMLNRKPDAKSWSVAQVLHHLITVEEASLRYLRKKTQNVSGLKKSGMISALRLIFLKAVYSLPFKYKAPQVVEPMVEHATLEQLDAQWIEVRKNMTEFIGRMKEEELRIGIWKHPIGGRMNLFQMLAFFESHVQRHEEQIQRTLENIKR